jgi:hypothetical protein
MSSIPLAQGNTLTTDVPPQTITLASGGGGAWLRRKAPGSPTINNRKYKGQRLGVRIGDDLVELPFPHMALLSDERFLDRTPLTHLEIVEL